MPCISQVLGEKTEKRRRKKLRALLLALPNPLAQADGAKNAKRGTDKAGLGDISDGMSVAWLSALTGALEFLAGHDSSELVNGGQALTVQELVADLTQAGAVDILGQLLKADAPAVASGAAEVLGYLFHVRENPVTFAAGGHLSTLAQLLTGAPLVVRIHAASALSTAVAIASDTPTLTLPTLLQTCSHPQPNKKAAAASAAVLSPRTAGGQKRGKKGAVALTPCSKALAAEAGLKQAGGSIIEGLLRLAETSVANVQDDLAGVNAPPTMAFLRRQFGPAMDAAPSEAEAARACSPLLAQLARSVALGCLARILGASCQHRAAKADLLSVHGATLVPLLLRAISTKSEVAPEERSIAGTLPLPFQNQSPVPVAPTIVHTPEVGDTESGAAAKKSPKRFSLSSMACGFLPNLLSVPGAAKAAPSTLHVPGKPEESLPDAGSLEFELVNSCDGEGAIHTSPSDVYNPVDAVHISQPVDSADSRLSSKLPVIITRCTDSSPKPPNPSPITEKDLPETVTAAARCLAFLGYRPFPLWQAAEAPREEARELEEDEFVVVDLEKETRVIWDQMHGEVPNPLAPSGVADGPTLQGAILPLANAALAAIENVQKLCAGAGDPPLEGLANATAHAVLLMDCCANLTHDLAVAERLATEGPIVRSLTSLVETLHGLAAPPPSKTGPPPLRSALCDTDRRETFHLCTAQKATPKASAHKKVQPEEALEALDVPTGPDAVLPMPPASRKPGMTFGYSTEIAHHAPPVYASLLILVANLALATTASVLPACFASAMSAQVEATKQRGNEALNKGDHEYARWCYNLALRLAHSAAAQDAQLYPQRHILWSNRAEACLRGKRFADALHDVDQALVIDPGHLKSVLRRERAVRALSEGELGKENIGAAAK